MIKKVLKFFDTTEDHYLLVTLGILAWGAFFEYRPASVLVGLFIFTVYYIIRAIRTAPKPSFMVVDSSTYCEEKRTEITAEGGPVVVMTREGLQSFEGKVSFSHKNEDVTVSKDGA